MMTALGWLAFLTALLSAALCAANLRVLRRPEPDASVAGELVSILIPARNEAANIGPALMAARASRGVAVEVIVMDDGSTDGTAELVQAQAAEDARVRLVTAPPLPEGWSGKVHACQRLADAARGRYLLFVDADVRLEPAAAAALASHAQAHGIALVSGVPRQIMRSMGEFLTVPMINFLLLGYLPIARMRRTTDPAMGAACGQLLLVRRDAYDAVGGHESVRRNIHDALMLVRRFRSEGHRTDLVLGNGLATCRMYESLSQAWAGFIKNAREGMAKPVALPIWTLLLAPGHVLPVLLTVLGLLGLGPVLLPAMALLLSLGARLAVSLRTGESLWTVPLHPLTVAMGLAIQWTALLSGRHGRAAQWKGRLYHAS